MPRKFIDQSGQVFGRWSVLSFSMKKGRENYWLCQCSCGSLVEVSNSSLIHGKSKSCGCLQKELFSQQRYKHGHSLGNRKTNRTTKEYRAWCNMMTRCYNQANHAFQHYGGRGITVCNRWHNFLYFLDDVGYAPDSKLTLERLDNDKGYIPGNVVWATRTAQVRNTRATRKVTYQDKTMTLKDWSEYLDIPFTTLRNRFYKKRPLDQVFAKIGD